MPAVHPFRAIHYADASKERLSHLIAPPYDVLDEAGKQSLLAKDRRNIVAIDLPHMPPKELGPPEAYAESADRLRRWLEDGTLVQHENPVLFVYRQTYEHGGRTYGRTGMACTLEVLPFGPREGGGVLPHEQTFSGPKADRLALMQSTATQLSPIFGLHEDAKGIATTLLQEVAASRPADHQAEIGDGILHEVWVVEDDTTQTAYARALQGEDVFIADGHHRYNTALNYLAALEAEGEVPADHPARRVMMVLVSMSDPGLVIGPTHRVLGGMESYGLEAFLEAAGSAIAIEEHAGGIQTLEAAIARHPATTNALGLYDFASGRSFVATPKSADPLAERCAEHSSAWRSRDVSMVQYLVVEAICQPELNGGQPVQWAFPHTIEEVLALAGSREKDSSGGGSFSPQLAVIVRPTPLEAVRTISRSGELMPQKSTFFTPKIATGLFLNPLR